MSVGQIKQISNRQMDIIVRKVRIANKIGQNICKGRSVRKQIEKLIIKIYNLIEELEDNFHSQVQL